MIPRCIVCVFWLLCNTAMLLFEFPGDAFSAIICFPLWCLLWLVGTGWAIILLIKNSARKERHWYLAFIPCVCIVVMAILPFLPFPWHIWNAQISYLCNRNEWQEVINNPAKENLISQTEQRTVIGFPPKNSMLTRYETRTVYISDDALPQKEMFPMAEQVTVFRKLAPGWFYVQLKY